MGLTREAIRFDGCRSALQLPFPMHSDSPAENPSPQAKSGGNNLYLQVLVGIVLGGLLGYVRPAWGVALEPLGTAFVNLVKMLIAPNTPTFTVTRFGTGPGPTLLRFDALGRPVPEGKRVMKPGPFAFT